MTSKLTRNFPESSSNAQRYNHINKVNLKNMKNSNTTASSLYNMEIHNYINKLSNNNSRIITQQRKELLSQSNIFYKNIEIARQQAIEQRSKFLARMYHTSFQNQFETDLQKKVKLLAEQSKKRQAKLKEVLVRVNQKFEYFHENGWLVPDQLDIDKLDNINSPEDANTYMENNLTEGSGLLLLTLNTCLDQENLPDNAHEILGNVINSLKKDYSNYKVMLPTIFSVIDCIIKERLGEFIEKFSYVNKKTIGDLKEKTDQQKSTTQKDLFYLYQSSMAINILSTRYYPLENSKEDTILTRNSVAHGSFDYTKYTVSDFAKVVLLIEHVSGLREFLEE